MITKEQAASLNHRDIVHFIGRQQCTRTVGPRGGVTIKVVECRVNGNLKTWVRDPERWVLPVKHGMREYGAVSNTNNYDWHVASECPINNA